MHTNGKGSLFWYVWHACRMEQRDILSVVLSLASPRPLDYSRLFTARSAVSAVWRGASFVKNYICLSCTFFSLYILFSRRSERISTTASEFMSPSLHCAVNCQACSTTAAGKGFPSDEVAKIYSGC